MTLPQTPESSVSPEVPMARPRSRLSVLQRAGYRCQARTPEGFACNAPASMVDRTTQVAVCRDHLSQTSHMR